MKKEIKEKKELYLIGTGIGRSLSPAMHNAAIEKVGTVDASYSLLDLKDNSEFDRAVQRIRNSEDSAAGVLGFNLTTPFKTRVMPFLDSIDERARAVGAVNTVAVAAASDKQSARLSGFNTDCDGILLSLSKLGVESGKKAVVLGAGGAARACAYVLLAEKRFGSVLILNRTLEKAKRITSDFEGRFPNSKMGCAELDEITLKHSLNECDLLINAISNSSSPSDYPVKIDFSLADPKRLKVFDLGYKFPESFFFKSATSRSFQAIDGLPMLVEQAARAFEIWFEGQHAPRETMLLAGEKARRKAAE